MPSTQHPDGRWTHTFSASWLAEYAQCPERARRRYFGITRSFPNDFTALGSAVHAGIEGCIRTAMGEADHRYPLGEAMDALEAVEAEPGFVEAGKFDAAERRRLVTQHITTFSDRVLEELKPVAVEHEFDVALHEDPFREVRLRGRIDYIDAELGLIDWKTAGSPHKTWEKERHDVQSTVYLVAEEARTGVLPDGLRYVVFVHDKDMQTYRVERTARHVEWLRQQALVAARLVEANLPRWTLNDAGWHCAEKWCPAWSDCKGAALNPKGTK